MNVLRKYIGINKQIDFICGTVKKGSKIYAGFRPQDIHKQLNIIPSSVVGFYIKMNSLKKVGLLNLSYKIQSDYDLIYRMIVTHKLKGIRTKGTEIFGSLGDSGFSNDKSFIYCFTTFRFGFFDCLFVEFFFIFITIFTILGLKKLIKINQNFRDKSIAYCHQSPTCL